jgi:glutaredoxin-related protein
MHAKIKQLQSRHRRALSIGLVVFATALLLLPSIHVDVASAQGSAVTRRIDLQWYDLTARAIAAAKFPAPVTESRVWADSWLAAARAIGNHRNSSYSVAAFVTALHNTLAVLIPSQRSQLDTALELTLASVPDGYSKNLGVAAGRRSAIAVLAERSGDGLDPASVDIPFTPPSPAPSVWQPTPPTFGSAVRAGEGLARPFLLRRNNQFRAPPPPALNSKTYLNALAEIQVLGSATDSIRTPGQTHTALFWTDQSIHIFVPVLRAVLADARGSLAWRARLVAAFHVISIDAQIAIYESKYTYLFWRPVTAIRHSGIDPNANWMSLVTTPLHPEYPSGHCGYAGAAVQVLTTLIGLRPYKPISIQSATDPGSTRTYRRWSTFTQENTNGRVWGGIHFRFSDQIGVQIGQQVANYDLPRLRLIGL